MQQNESKNKSEMPLVSICLNTFNGRKYYGDKYERNKRYLEEVLNSIKNQTYKNMEIIVLDDCSEEDPTNKINLIIPEAIIVRNDSNLGLLKSQNKAIKMTHGKYVLMLNQDIKLQEDYVEKLLKVMEKDSKIGVSSGKIKRFFLNSKNELEFTNIIDTAGMIFNGDRNIRERGQLEEDRGQYDKQQEVFGVAGTVPFYRKEALENIKLNKEYYDEDFWAYKDDVDMCWRLNLMGWKCVYCPQTFAYHDRTAGGIAEKYRENFITRRFGYIIHRIIKKNGGASKVRRRDFCNHYLTIIKNDSWQSILRSIIPFGWREFQKLVFGIFFEPNVYFPGWVDFFKKSGKIREKRRIIQSRRLISWREMEEKFEKGIW